MSKISEWGFPALYRSLVAKPGQMPLFSARAQPVAEPVRKTIKIIDAETGAFITVPTIEAAEAHIEDARAELLSYCSDNSGSDVRYRVTYFV